MYLHNPNPKAFIEYSNTMDDVYKNRNYYNIKRRQKNLVAFDDIIPGINTDKKFQAMVKILVFRWRKLSVSLIFITQSFLIVLKEVRLNSRNYLITKTHNKTELQHIDFNHSADIVYKDFINIHEKHTIEPYSFLTIDTTFLADNLLHFRKNRF